MKKLFILLACISVLLSCNDNDKKKSEEALFIEPLVNFGVSKAAIKNREKRPLINEEEVRMIYSGGGYYVIYLFEDGKLLCSEILLSPFTTDQEDLDDFLSSRYDFIAEIDQYLVWMSKNKDMSVVVNAETWGIYILYVPTSLLFPPETQIFPSAQLSDETVLEKIRVTIHQLMQ